LLDSKLGITQEFNNSDNAKIYNYAGHAIKAPIETVDASIAPPEKTIEQLDASSILPPEIVDPSGLIRVPGGWSELLLCWPSK
jgi:hypothetical protein